MIFQIVAFLLGLLGVVIRYTTDSSGIYLIIAALALYLIIDIIGMITGMLAKTPFTVAPVIPALFWSPWYVGLLVGFLAISLVDMLFVMIIGRKLSNKRYRLD